MELKKYLDDTFRFNDRANKRILKIAIGLPGKNEIIKYFSHLINRQFKWMAGIMQDPNRQKMDWWNPVYEFNELEEKWNESLEIWLNYIKSKTEEELLTEVTITDSGGGVYAVTPADIALQLNYHSIHHRAQMQMVIRQQGLTPDFVDYIGTKYRKLK
jgi:uncharacterized damage-inducible protein DinB